MLQTGFSTECLANAPLDSSGVINCGRQNGPVPSQKMEGEGWWWRRKNMCHLPGGIHKNGQGHVACLQRYYDSPTTCRDAREHREISARISIPNCFVSRRTSASIVPFDTDVLRAILPEVETSVQQWTREEANKALDCWLEMCHLLVKTLWCDSDTNFAMIQLFAAVGFKNGRKKRRKFLCWGEPTIGTECWLCLTTILQKLVAGWGSLPVNHECYDKFTCQMFSLHEIVEILVQVKVSQYLFDYVTQVPVYHVDVGIHGLIFWLWLWHRGVHDFPESLDGSNNASIDPILFGLRTLFALSIPVLTSKRV